MRASPPLTMGKSDLNSRSSAKTGQPKQEFNITKAMHQRAMPAAAILAHDRERTLRSKTQFRNRTASHGRDASNPEIRSEPSNAARASSTTFGSRVDR